MRADERFGTIPCMARASAERFGDRDALVDGDVRLTFVDVERGMVAVARSLLASGVQRGDRVAVWAPNSATWVLAALGLQAVGAWLVPLNTRLKGEEAAYILRTTDARTLFVADGFLGIDYVEALRAAGPDLAALDDVVVVPPPTEAASPTWAAFLERGDAVPVEQVDEALAAGGSDDVSDVIFTSGTTGLPKGVMLRHGASLRGYGIWSDRFVLNGESRYVIPTPFFHCFGYKAGWMSSLMAGAMAIPLAVFDAERVMAIIEREGVTHMPGPPTMFNAILDHPRRRSHDLTSLRHVMVGATTVAPSLIRRVSDELGIETQLSAYGLTENHALASLSEPEDPLEVVATTAGRPFPEVEMRMVDDDGHEVPAGQPGEILLRSPYAMSGYYADPDATAAALAGGWLHTGDIGRFDDDGRLLVTDRKKDMFIAGGFNVAPAEVEKVLVAIVGVAQVAVVGMPDDYLGEVGAAFVVLDDGASVDPADIVAFAREHLANFKVPRRVELVDQLPMNATGKVVKADLRAWLARPDGAATTGAEPVG